MKKLRFSSRPGEKVRLQGPLGAARAQTCISFSGNLNLEKTLKVNCVCTCFGVHCADQFGQPPGHFNFFSKTVQIPIPLGQYDDVKFITILSKQLHVIAIASSEFLII